VVAKLGGNSISGGVFAFGGAILCTGHDLPEVYVLSLPTSGSTLVLRDTFAVSNHGQGIAWDHSEPGMLYGIDRPKRQVIVMRVRAS
jgi:hypothetical protein